MPDFGTDRDRALDHLYQGVRTTARLLVELGE
jgi:hypothetical protein